MLDLEEDLSIDIDLDIEHAFLTALKETISKNISVQWNEKNSLISKETLLKNFLAYNMDKIEEECYCTKGPDGKVYACGEWLIRPIRYHDKMIPTMDCIIAELNRRKISTEKIVFCPDISGTDMRKKLWKETNPLNSSYDIPRSGKDSFGQKRVIPQMGAGGPPPGMGFGPPPGMMGAGGPPPGMGFGPPPGTPPFGAGAPSSDDAELEELEEIPEADLVEDVEELEEI